MTTPRTRFLAASAAAFVLVFGAACGVSTDDNAGSEDASTQTTAAPVDTTTGTTEAEATDTTVDDSDSTDTTVDDSDSTDTTVDDSGGSLEIPEEARQQVIDIYTDMGLSEEQANCMLDAISEEGVAENFDTSDISAMMDFLGQCDISITDFSGGGLGG